MSTMTEKRSTVECDANPPFSHVFLRLPSQNDQPPRAHPHSPVKTEHGRGSPWTTHITLQSSVTSQRCAVEKFKFTRIVQDQTPQIGLFEQLGMPNVIDTLLHDGRDGLLISAGATRNGKPFAVHGSKTELGMSQISLYVLFKSLSKALLDPRETHIQKELTSSDACDSEVLAARSFFARLDDITNHDHDEVPNCHPMEWTRPHAAVAMDGSCPASSARPFTSRIMPFLRRRTHNKITPDEPLNRGLDPQPHPRPMSFSGIIGRKAQFVGSKKLFSKPPQPPMPSSHPFSHAPTGPNQNAQAVSHQSRVTPSLCPADSNPRNQSSENGISDDVPVNGYVILISVYEVRNERIYDLLRACERLSRMPLSARHNQATVQFKHTRHSGQHNKVVAGLVKVACATYEEAIVVLESGLLATHTVSTSTNSGAKSHVFVCIDVKRRTVDRRGRGHRWDGSSLTIVDIADPRNEDGRMSAELMSLGRCLQIMQKSLPLESNYEANKILASSKLAAILFHNNVKSPTSAEHRNSKHDHRRRNSLMVLTVDPYENFDAASQVLRYFALGRTATVPRTMALQESIARGKSSDDKFPKAATSARDSGGEEKSSKASSQIGLELSALSLEYEALALKLLEEEHARAENEVKWLAAEERCLDIEQRVREVCWEEMEKRLEETKKRWSVALQDQAARHDEHLGRKLDLLTKSLEGHIEPSFHDRMGDLSRENLGLKARVAGFEREHQHQSPTKRYPKIKATTAVIKQPKKKASLGEHSISSPPPSSPDNENDDNDDDSFVTCMTSLQSSPRSMRGSEHNGSPCHNTNKQTYHSQQIIPPPRFMLAPKTKPDAQKQDGSVT